MISERNTSLVLCGSWGRNERPAHIDVWHEASAETLRYVPERTCRAVRSGEPSPTGVPRERRCSECGGMLTRFGSYCPNCEARVAREGI